MELMPNVDMSPPTKIECQASGDWEGGTIVVAQSILLL